MIKAIAMIRKLDKTEYDRATSLALEVYIQSVSYTHLTLPTIA